MSESELDGIYPGIDRLHYFLCHIGMFAAVMFVIAIFGPDSGVMKMLTLPLMVMSVVLDVLRLRNVGVSQWFSFIRFLPFGNTILAIFLLSAQPGWAETRRLDSAGRSIAICVFSVLALLLLLVLRPQTSMPFWF